MSIVYSKRFVSWQNLADGSSITCYLQAPPNPLQLVIRTFSLYFGAPSPVASNSVVLIDDNADDGKPTIISYDSGITESNNPIYQTFDGFWPLTATPESPGLIPMFSIVNTSNSISSVDVFVGGWALQGFSPVVTIINTP